jgi:hypothetical protein
MEADRHAVAWNPELRREILALLGTGCVRVALSAGGGRKNGDDAGRGRREFAGRAGAGAR